MLDRMLSEGTITFESLDGLDPREIDQNLLDRLSQKRKEMEIKARKEEAQKVAKAIDDEIDDIDGKSDTAGHMMQHIQLRLFYW
jgi:hypothetical protein